MKAYWHVHKKFLHQWAGRFRTVSELNYHEREESYSGIELGERSDPTKAE
jgi:hypothetical protein